MPLGVALVIKGAKQMNLFFELFPNEKIIDIGKYVEMAIDYMKHNWDPFLNAIRSGMSWILLNMEKFFTWVPWWIFILIIFLLGIWLTDIKHSIIFSCMFIGIGLMGYWNSTMLTLSIVISSVFLSIIIGMILGILVSENRIVKRILRPILDAMQTTPSFVYLLPAIMLFNLGKVPAVFATTIYIISPIVRLTNLGIERVPESTIAAADAFGCSMWQKLFKVQIPQALPMIAAGINQAMLMSLSMVVVTSMIGAKGLGLDILTAISFIDIATAAEAGLSVIFVAIVLDRLTQGVANKLGKHV